MTERPYDFRHEANGCAKELFYREGPTPKALQCTDAEIVRDTIQQYLQEAFEAGRDGRADGEQGDGK